MFFWGCLFIKHINGKEEKEIKFDDGKPKLTLVPRKIIFAIAKIREYGVKKYKDPDNWKTVEKERYRDAAYRHFMAYLDDPDGADKESGLPHLWHLACNIAFLCEMEIPVDKFKRYMDDTDKVQKETEEFNHFPPTGVVNCHRCKYRELPIHEDPCFHCGLHNSLGKDDCLYLKNLRMKKRGEKTE